MNNGSNSSMSVVKSEKLEGVEYWSNPEWPIAIIDVVRYSKRVGYIGQTLTGLWESRLLEPLEFLGTWTTLELAKHDVETTLAVRDEQKRQQQLKAEREKDAEARRQMILGWALAGLGIAIIAVVIKVWAEYAKIGG